MWSTYAALSRAARASALFVPRPLVDWLSPFARDAGLKAFGAVAELPTDVPDAEAPPLVPSRPEDVAYLQVLLGQHALSHRRRWCGSGR